MFLSVQWESGNRLERLEKVLLHYEAVFSAWDENRLAGLVAVMDDGTMTAYVHYLLVYPRYQGYGVGSWLPGI
ncbi:MULTISPECIES: GNAT family N-acetyltransferase [Akkermansia]|uniref:GNAT family N-acetyltransferase n=1 Tax=Akkermansia TaxID=239934 RepID=UPI000AB8CA76|nr:MULTISPECIES: GNAT family N-acetyltransferase [Akkermansia]MCL6686801.1 GNAT family N-acetyltransferase [Akkermansia muciniphila]